MRVFAHFLHPCLAKIFSSLPCLLRAALWGFMTIYWERRRSRSYALRPCVLVSQRPTICPERLSLEMLHRLPRTADPERAIFDGCTTITIMKFIGLFFKKNKTHNSSLEKTQNTADTERTIFEVGAYPPFCFCPMNKKPGFSSSNSLD